MANQIGHVFLSYSRLDDSVMRRVLAFLRKKGLKIWVDDERLFVGTAAWKKAIEKAIIEAEAFIVLLSPTSCNSTWVQREISFDPEYR